MSGVTVAKYIIEAALFSAGKSITVEELSDATGLDKRTVRKAAKELIDDYSGRDSSLVVTKTATGYALEVRAKYARYTMKLAEQEIPRMALKTLAIIAFHQPIKQSKLKMMIGGRAYEDVKVLREMGLITVKPDGRSYRLETSGRFPDYFGIDPDPAEIKKHLADLVGVTLREVPEGDDDEDEVAEEGAEAPEESTPETEPVEEGGQVEGEDATSEAEDEGSMPPEASEKPIADVAIEEIEDEEAIPTEAAEEPVADEAIDEIEGSTEETPEPEDVGDEPEDDEEPEAPVDEIDDDEDVKYGSDAMKEVQDALHDDEVV